MVDIDIGLPATKKVENKKIIENMLSDISFWDNTGQYPYLYQKEVSRGVFDIMKIFKLLDGEYTLAAMRIDTKLFSDTSGSLIRKEIAEHVFETSKYYNIIERFESMQDATTFVNDKLSSSH